MAFKKVVIMLAVKTSTQFNNLTENGKELSLILLAIYIGTLIVKKRKTIR